MCKVEIWGECTGFQWDRHNEQKILRKHGVTAAECEQVFLGQPLVVIHDEKHSQGEQRFFALGKTEGARRLFVVFTIRGNLIRVISGRAMHFKERSVYAKYEKENP